MAKDGMKRAEDSKKTQFTKNTAGPVPENPNKAKNGNEKTKYIPQRPQ